MVSRRVVRRVLALVSLLLVPFTALAAEFDGHWSGEIAVPGQPLGIEVEFQTVEDGSLRGRISIPAQNLRGLDLVDVSRDGDEIGFRIPGIPGEPTFDGTIDESGDRIAGTFRQHGAQLTFELTRAGDPAETARRSLEGFDDQMRQALEDFQLPGLAVALVAGGEIVYAEGFGFRDVEGEKPMTPDTLFAVGSSTKAMTATLLGMLVDEGRLEWDEPVQTYLPTFRLSDPVVSRRVTPVDLVTHRTGLPRHDLLWYNENEASREELIARLPYLELSADLREKWQYNNLMFMTAGYLAGQRAGTTWEDMMRERLFEPLGMDRSNFRVTDSEQDPDHALPYRENDGELERIPFRRLDLIGPAGAVNSSVKEMARWVRFNLDGGRVGDRGLIEPATLAKIHAPQMPTGATPEQAQISETLYGMGWFVNTYRGHRMISHGGGIDGFVTSVLFLPDDGVGCVSFNNRGAGISELVCRTAVDRLLDLDPIDWLGDASRARAKGLELEEDAEEKKQATRVEGTSPSHDLGAYPGRYVHPGYGEMEFVPAEGGDLAVRFNGIEAPVEHWHYDVWSGAETDGDKTFENQKFLFRTNVDGLIAEVETRLEPTVDPIVFQRQPDARLSDPDYLQHLTGRYGTPTGAVVTISLAGDTLHLSIPGQPTFTLEPQLSGRFVLAEYRQVSVEFVLEGDEATALLLHAPNRIDEATRME